ncbi:MAG: 5-carboxymethyl-2-hydroxymuconate Delta-isomerase [Gammaproteobacteria bacterium]|nr:5-carboxymethyl-2-hydroxymuconate Delta-isomerase [Gammaproteobacteria bacterium]
MPHIIVEYSEFAIPEQEVGRILRTVHSGVVDSGLFENSHIKTRAYPFKDYTHGDGDEPYIHIQARIKSGRDADMKKRLSDGILQSVSSVRVPVSVITVEVIDMDRESYGKYSYKS